MTTMREFTDEFDAAGFGVVRRAVDPDTTDRLRAALTAMLPPEAADQPAARQRVVPRIVHRDPAFAELAMNTHLVGTVTGLFGGVVPHLVCCYGHEKPARTGAHTGPHSDVAHLPGVPHHRCLLMVKVMLALTPVDAESGATTVAAGSHRWASGAEADERSAAYQRVLLSPGDLLLFHANLRHSATDNTSDTPRLSVWLVYAQPWMRVFPGYEHDPSFLEELRPRRAAEPYLADVFGLTDPYATTPTRQTGNQAEGQPHDARTR
jgi:hypothetical protein